MDKVKYHKALARQISEEISAIDPSSDWLEIEPIIDDERGRYLLFQVGWQKHHWYYGPIVHLDVKPDGKIWLQHDGTDLILAHWLTERGVAKSDIVLGFHAPSEREDMAEWAVG